MLTLIFEIIQATNINGYINTCKFYIYEYIWPSVHNFQQTENIINDTS